PLTIRSFRIFLFLGIIFPSISISQTFNADSAFSALMASGKPDSLKMVGVEEIIGTCLDEGSYDKTIHFCDQGIILAQRFGFQKFKGLFLHKKGVAYFNLGNFPQALTAYQQALSLREEIGDSLGTAKTLGNIGNTYNEMANYSKAMDMHLRTIKICEKIHDESVLKNSFSSLGDIYKNTGEYEKSIEYHTKSLKIEEVLKNKEGIAKSLGNLGKVYFLKKEYETALSFQQQALAIAKEIEDDYTIANTLLDIGGIYQEKKEYRKSLEFYEEGKKKFEAMGDKSGLVTAELNIGSVYISLDKLKEAEQISIKAIALAKELGMTESESEGYKNLPEIYEKMHLPLKAYDAFKKYILLRDSINSEANQKEMVKHEMSYVFDKKESEMIAEEEKRAAIAASESQRQRVVIYGVSFGFLLVLILVAVVYRNLRENKKKNKIIETQKAEVEHKQKEILDSILYAQRIQKALLASEALLNENLPEHFVLFKPKDIVSGDFYWATVAHNKFYLVTADSTGHGVPGAFMSLLNISFLNEAINEKHFEHPHDALNHTRSRLISSLKADGSEEGGKDGMDCILTAFDFKNNLVEYAAANNGFYIVRNGELLSFKADKMPVGKSPRDHESFTSQKIELQKGDTVYTLTDGFPDQFGGPKGKKFKYKPLEEILLANCHLSMQQQKELLLARFEDWRGDLEQVDDVLLIGIKI
ncbi:MAG: tetratricopeptide repeat protein, partial [Bacteroidia bacterium]